MGVEPGRNQDQIGREGFQGRQQAAAHGGAPGFAAGAGRQGHVDHIVGDAVLGGHAGAGIGAGLVGRGEEQVGIVLEYILGAVAVMDVEIDHGDAPHLMDLARMQGADGDIVEKTEAHRACPFRVMARRTHRAEGVDGTLGHHQIDGRHHRAGGTPRRIPRAGAENGVRIHRR